MTTHRSRKVGWLTAWAVLLALSGSIACGSATSATPGGSPGGAGGSAAPGGTGGRTAIRSVGNTHRGFVSSGRLLKSSHFQMISALGPPAVASGASSSAQAQVRSGLVPNISE